MYMSCCCFFCFSYCHYIVFVFIYVLLPFSDE